MQAYALRYRSVVKVAANGILDLRSQLLPVVSLSEDRLGEALSDKAAIGFSDVSDILFLQVCKDATNGKDGRERGASGRRAGLRAIGCGRCDRETVRHAGVC